MTGLSSADEDLERLLATLGGAQGFVRGTLRDTSNVTMLESGYKHNVIPQTASAAVDCRFLPGHEDALMATIRELAGEHVEVEVVHMDVAIEAPFSGDLVESMKQALLREDPEAAVLPYCLSGGTDNKALSRLGISGYGFAPLRLPADLDFARCSTASTSVCPSTRCVSGRASSATSCAPAEVGRRRQAVRCTRMIFRRSHIRRTPPS